MDRPTVEVFVVRCPLGEHCSKKSGILAKKLNPEAAKTALKHHLRHSPYHELTEEEAATFMDAVEVESWEEESAAVTKFEDDQQDWYQSRKRKQLAIGQAAPATRSSSSAIATMGRIQMATMSETTVQLNGSQLMACIESLKRARVAAESAANLAAKASRAFNEEAITVRQCEDVLRSYLD